MDIVVPDSCTLPTTERPARVAEFAALLGSPGTRTERISQEHLRVTLTGGEQRAATVRDLVVRESACCSFFDFRISTAGTHVVLDVRVPAEQAEVLDGLASTSDDTAG